LNEKLRCHPRPFNMPAAFNSASPHTAPVMPR
jgi:hypothetical protein